MIDGYDKKKKLGAGAEAFYLHFDCIYFLLFCHEDETSYPNEMDERSFNSVDVFLIFTELV